VTNRVRLHEALVSRQTLALRDQDVTTQPSLLQRLYYIERAREDTDRGLRTVLELHSAEVAADEVLVVLEVWTPVNERHRARIHIITAGIVRESFVQRRSARFTINHLTAARHAIRVARMAAELIQHTAE